MNGSNELWRKVEGYPSYSVSSKGRVCSNNLYSHKKPLIMTAHPDKDGHMKIRLCNKGKAQNFFVHRLVAIAFIENPDNLPIVNHKDENPANNCVENLEWCTAQENTVYKNMPQRRANPLKIPIIQKTLNGEFVRAWKSRSDIQNELGYSGGNITLVCQGKRKSAYGFSWEYQHSHKKEWNEQ